MPTFPACNTEQVYTAILKSSKINDLFQNCQIYSRRIFETSVFPWYGFCEAENVMRRKKRSGSENKGKDGKKKKIISSNSKDQISES